MKSHVTLHVKASVQKVNRPQPRSQGLLRFQDGGAEKTLAHTVMTPTLIGVKI